MSEACGGSLGRYLSRGTIYVKGRQVDIKKSSTNHNKNSKKNKYNYKHKIEEKAVATTKKKQQEVTKTINNEKVRKN